MANKNTHLVIVVDRSGSMASIASDMSGGIAQLIKEQKELEGKLRVTLAQFDTEYELVWDAVDIKDVGTYDLVPRGATALLDGLGRTLAHVEEKTNRKSDLVIVAVITDGYENASTEWTRAGVKAAVERLTNHDWNFTFLGANIDSFAEGSSIAFASAATMDFNTSSAGVSAAYGSVSNNVTGLRSGVTDTINYSKSDREAAKK